MRVHENKMGGDWLGRDSGAIDGWLAMPAAERLRTISGHIERARSEADSHRTYSAIVDQASELPNGSLGGLPIAVKENIDVLGLPPITETAFDRDKVVEIDAAIIAALRFAGVTVIGKTRSFEVAFAPTTLGRAGPALNPMDPARIAGGSSGASAATVARGTVPLSLATDTSGSTLVPASFCGVVGYRATVGRYPIEGVRRHSWTRDAIGIHARTALDIGVIDQILSLEGSHAESVDGDIVLGVVRSRFRNLDGEVERVIDLALDKVIESGVRLVDVEIRNETELSSGPGMAIVLWEAKRLVSARASTDRRGGPLTLTELIESAVGDDLNGLLGAIEKYRIDSRTYSQAQGAQADLRRVCSKVFDDTRVDALLYPTCPVVAPELGAEVVRLGQEDVPLRAVLVRNTTPGTVAGLPMMSVPVGKSSDGLPVGVCLEAPPWSDRTLLQLGQYLQEVFNT
jgi:Asp-tRNA(Asn)/Glu-tRNA(Gln) amidotransferase A subunit family amidase